MEGNTVRIFMEGSKDLLLDTKDLGTLSWREVRIF